LKQPKELEKNIEYVEKRFGKEYVIPLIITKSKEHLEKVLSFLQEKGMLPVVLTSASILSLTLEDIEERMEYLKSHNKPIVVLGRKKEQAFNPALGISRARYEKLLEKEKRISSRLTDGGRG